MELGRAALNQDSFSLLYGFSGNRPFDISGLLVFQ